MGVFTFKNEIARRVTTWLASLHVRRPASAAYGGTSRTDGGGIR